MKNNSSILIILGLIICGFLSSCGSETDSGLQDGLNNGHITTDINEADGFTTPQGSLMINDGEVATNKIDVILTLSGSDAVGVTGYYVSSQSANPTISDSNWNSITSTTLFSKQVSDNISTVEQSYSFYAWYSDGSGNISAQSSSSIIYDVTAPTSTSVSINSGTSTTSSTGVSLTLSATDNVGVTGYYTSESSSTPSLDASGWKNVTSSTAYSGNVSFSLSSGEGDKTVYAWFRDVAGNISTSSSDNITKTGVDTSAPSGSITKSCGMILTATDNIGVTGYYLSQYSTTPSATSSGWTNVTSTTSFRKTISSYYSYTYYYVWYKDAAGNISSRYSTYVGSSSSDSTAPSGSISLSDSGSSTVTVSLSATDSCGVTGYYLSTSSSNPSTSSSSWTAITSTTSYTASVSYTFSSFSGSDILYVWFKDAQGNRSSRYSATHNVSLLINSGDSYTNSLSVTITMSENDSTGVTGYYFSETSSTPPISASGWEIVTSTTSFSKSISHTFGSGEGTKTVYVWFRNSGGTISERYSASIIYETVAPTGSVIINSGSSSTSIHLVTLSLSSSDSYGVTSYCVSSSTSCSSWVSVTSSTSFSLSVEFTLTTGNGSKTVYAWFKDGAGNVSSRYSDSITLAFIGEISAGGDHTCGLYPTGTIQCWGKGSSYQLGNGSASSASNAVSVSGISSAVELATGGNHSCALLSDGTVKCWGSGNYGQMGDYSNSNNSTPNLIYDTGAQAIQINSGTNHICVVNQIGTVLCWGYNAYGQIGNNNTTNQSYPQEVSGLIGVSQVALGSLHSCALLSSGGVECWGFGGNGQLGNGSTSNSNTPVSVSGISTATKISSGSSHTCARLSNGVMKCWGYGGNGQLGDDSLVDRSTPVSVSGISTAADIGGGDQHTCAVLSSGSVKCWGGNSYGQLGDSSNTSRKTATSVTSLSNASKITLGESHTCSLNTDNSSKCWGRNNSKQLGTDNTTDSNFPIVTSFLINDYTAPTGSVTISKSRYYYSAYVSLSATDNVGVTAYCVKTSSLTPSSSDSCWTSVTSTTNFSQSSISISSYTSRYKTSYAYAWFRDGAGNVSSQYSDSTYCSYYCN